MGNFKKIKDLNLAEYLVLEFLINNPNFFEDNTDEFCKIENILLSLETNGYLRIISNEEVIVTEKGNNLFSTKLDKSAQELLDYFNELKKEHFKSKTPYRLKTYKSVINERLSEFSLETLKGMLKFMFQKWKNSDMEQYLVPNTLFRASKTPNYVEMYERANNDETLNRM